MTLDNQIKNYNYRVDIFYKNSIMNENKLYTVTFPEFWLAKKYAVALLGEEDIVGIYLLERASDDNFDIVKRYK